MLTLGQASCLVLGYKPNDPEERKKAKEHLEKSGLIAVHICNHDPFRPMAIGINVHDRDPFNLITLMITMATTTTAITTIATTMAATIATAASIKIIIVTTVTKTGLKNGSLMTRLYHSARIVC